MTLACFDKFENETVIKSYRIKEEKVLQKNNIIPLILVKIQEILKLKFNDQNLTITKAYNLLKNSVIKMNIQNSLNFVDLFMANSVEKFDEKNNFYNISHFSFDYFILKKNESKNLIDFSLKFLLAFLFFNLLLFILNFILDSGSYFSKSFDLGDKYIQYILRTNYNFLNKYLTSNQYVTINYIVINALVLEKNTACN